MFSFVTEDRLLPEFPLFLPGLAPKLRYFAKLHWMVLLQGASRLNQKLNYCPTWLVLLLPIYFSTMNIHSSAVNWGIFSFYWLFSKTSSFILIPIGTKLDKWHGSYAYFSWGRGHIIYLPPRFFSKCIKIRFTRFLKISAE